MLVELYSTSAKTEPFNIDDSSSDAQRILQLQAKPFSKLLFGETTDPSCASQDHLWRGKMTLPSQKGCGEDSRSEHK